MRKVSSLLILLNCFLTLTAQVLNNVQYETNGYVYSMLQSGNTVYVGGSFSLAVSLLSNGALIDASSGNPNISFPKPNGQVFSVIDLLGCPMYARTLITPHVSSPRLF